MPMPKKTTLLSLVALGAMVTHGALAEPAAEGAPTTSSVEDVSTTKQAADYYIAQILQIAQALGQVSTEAQADAATAKIDAALQNLNQLFERMEGKISKSDWLAETMNRQQELAQVQTQLGMALASVAQTNPALMQRIAEKLKDMPSYN